LDQRHLLAQSILDHTATAMWIFLILAWSGALVYLLFRKRKKKK
jgi:hypothetical protein